MYSFLEVKLQQSLKTWTKINMIFVFKKQHTVKTLCLQFKSNIWSRSHNKSQYRIKVSIIFTEYFNLLPFRANTLGLKTYLATSRNEPKQSISTAWQITGVKL